MKKWLYKARGSFFNSGILSTLILAVISIFFHYIIALLAFILLVVSVLNCLSDRVYVYEDKIVYKHGILLKTSYKMMPLRNVCSVTYNSSLFSKILNYGDVIIGTYNNQDSFVLIGIRNAKMLAENITSLIEGKRN